MRVTRTTPAAHRRPEGAARQGPCRVGLVGCGVWGKNILRDLLSLGCEVHVADVLADRQEEALAAGCKAAYETLMDLPELDGCVVATPISTHAEVLNEIIDRRPGLPVFVEKPLTNDAASAAHLALKAPLTLFLMDKWRYHHGIEMLADIARREELGPLVGLRTTRIGWGNAREDGIWTLAPHDLSIAIEILGGLPPPKFASAQVEGGRPVGMIAVMGVQPWFIMDVSVRNPIYRREILLHCRDGFAVLSDGNGYSAVGFVRSKGHLGIRPPAMEWRPVSGELPLLRELGVFVEFLKGGPPPKTNAAGAADVVKTISGLRVLAGLTP